MDFETIILGLLCLGAFLVPIFYIQRMQTGQTNKALKVFLAAAEQQGLHLSKHDLWNEQYGIGLDETKGKLYYWHNDAVDPQEVLIDLGTVRRSTVENMYREVNGNRIIDSIGLRVSLHGAKAPELYLPFYTKEGSMMLSNELPLAEKWNAILQSAVVTPQAVKV
ncbi:hypothetical protein [uncultured Pontibacter sp.]|uniref:hypothetical protein n=1 Tax=uncultured Pontibacter sp. TaxID=453356 RepID=UPI002617C72C|nr:hypothetical protein [uncultured Pontibacter sp.]